MSTSLLAHLYAHPYLFRKGELVYIRDPDQEKDEEFANALKSLIEQLEGDGPFTVTRIRDTPSSKIAPQQIEFGQQGSFNPFMNGDSPLQITGYALETRP